MGEKISQSNDGYPINIKQINGNFTDIHPAFNAQKVISESSRCLFCYDAPCVQACPTAIDIPKFIHQIRTENINGSAKTILSSNIMGGSCARVCPTEILCEAACVRIKSGEKAVEIGQLQRYSIDKFMMNCNEHPFIRAKPTGKIIAVIGAGPAGLSCAYKTAELGHDIVIFEAEKKSGGLNEYGLAAYKMVNDYAQKEIDFLLQIGGIKIEHGKEFGKDITISQLQNKFDAIFIAAGLGNINALHLDGENKIGIEDAISFIKNIRQTNDKQNLDVGDDIIVIGGGNTAIDAAVQAKRLGANNVTLVYRRGAEQMGATIWEQDLAKTNGINIVQWAKPTAIIRNEDDKIKAMTFEKTILIDGKLIATGKFFNLTTDHILKAIGQTLELDLFEGLELSGNKIKVNSNYQTSIKDVFAGGDCIDNGEDLTVQAVADGNKAAIAINDFLKSKK